MTDPTADRPIPAPDRPGHPAALTAQPLTTQPLAGQTLLLVEDIRLACEALRLMALRSGARIRRADSLRAAHRHLQVFRPTVLIVDLGLPDGPGEALIREMSAATPRIPVILGTSGEDGGALLARMAGADGFLPKPLPGLAAFQRILLQHLGRALPDGAPTAAPDEGPAPDALALRDDLARVAATLDAGPADDPTLDYLARFTRGLARVARDDGLAAVSAAMADAMGQTGGPAREAARRRARDDLQALLRARLAEAPAL